VGEEMRMKLWSENLGDSGWELRQKWECFKMNLGVVGCEVVFEIVLNKYFGPVVSTHTS
jgi:hypothetical protein